MRIGFTSYPMLWQRTGGLQVQINQTIISLRQQGIEATYLNPQKEKLSSYDLIHVFSATHGMYLTIEEARFQKIKTVISPVFQPVYNPAISALHLSADWLCRQLTNNQIKTSHQQTQSALQKSDHIIALSQKENFVIQKKYKIDSKKITIIPNGVQNEFFNSTTELFDQKFGISHGFTLVAGTVSPYKNQLSVIRATEGPVVLVGQIADQNYFQKCKEEAGARMVYIGVIDYQDPLLASVYAAAGVTVLASQGEAYGLTVIESLAAGTPAIITRKNGLDISEQSPLLQFVSEKNVSELKHKISSALANKKGNQVRCKRVVEHLKWDSVANSLQEVYAKTLSN